MKNIALIGMPGCFKSTVGKLLADKLSYTLYDTDALYEEIHGETIAHTFNTEGEQVFRGREAVIIAAVTKSARAVIATGGGAVLRSENVAALKRSCTVIELCADVHTVFERVKHDTSRPLLQDMRIETLEKMYRERKNLYKSAADYTVDTENLSPEQIAEKIIQLIFHKD